MKDLTAEQRGYLQTLKESGYYRPARQPSYDRILESVLFVVLYEYMEMRGREREGFKHKYFNTNKHNWQRYSIYADCPLLLGECRSAMRWGHMCKYVERIGTKSNGRWFFTDECRSWRDGK